MFRPFSGWLYDSRKIGDVGAATSPPYDVISSDDQELLEARSPHNIVRLLLPGRSPADYRRAGALLAEWKAEGILVRDHAPRFYRYDTVYRGPDGGRRVARGIVGALDLAELGADVVPHEETMHKHRDDRMSILESTGANLDPIIALSAAPELPDLLRRSSPEPRLEFTEADGSHHVLYDVIDSDAVAAVAASVGAHPVSIADGHHRYTTALAYRKRRSLEDGDGPWRSIMALVAPAEGSGLTIGPYHRLLPAFEFDPEAVAGAFIVEEAAAGPPAAPGSLTLVSNGRALTLTPRPDALEELAEPLRHASAAVAERILYPLLGLDEEGARYEADAADAASAAAEGWSVLLVAPIPEHAVAAAGEAGLRFPTKSTYFTPKPRAGLVVRCFDS